MSFLTNPLKTSSFPSTVEKWYIEDPFVKTEMHSCRFSAQDGVTKVSEETADVQHNRTIQIRTPHFALRPRLEPKQSKTVFFFIGDVDESDRFSGIPSFKCTTTNWYDSIRQIPFTLCALLDVLLKLIVYRSSFVHFKSNVNVSFSRPHETDTELEALS